MYLFFLCLLQMLAVVEGYRVANKEPGAMAIPKRRSAIIEQVEYG